MPRWRRRWRRRWIDANSDPNTKTDPANTTSTQWWCGKTVHLVFWTFWLTSVPLAETTISWHGQDR